MVAEVGADLGVAHDGDADRVLFVDASGNEVDGDRVLAICATDMAARGALARGEVVSTVMCNLGLVRAMGKAGIEVVQTAVGDRFVLQRMVADGAVIGGEQSGHIIFLEHNTTGDGLVTALQLMAVMKRTGKSLAELSRVMTRYPQALVNVRTQRKAEHASDPGVQEAVARRGGAFGRRRPRPGARLGHRAPRARHGRGGDRGARRRVRRAHRGRRPRAARGRVAPAVVSAPCGMAPRGRGGGARG